ncbi:nucleotidyltransferase domain-containing protein [Echinicola marina]|uniref:nucleotidyltransferase family protein n=1 Tax=Echinicola marina TaxID=2859768 RepID=UPI001CF646EE|nr:nucleotidyltransferase domain-containing protein [Echinicola marina]UCS92154.1 nucleotidyltransferase domain-containing protein [Echinicola marina]UCS92163.1 nucleotidyltransferase domain-containing protein [Echinicola marina]
MVDLIKNNQQALIALCKKYEIKTMHIFGSASTDQFNESSDIDILIAFKELPFEKYTDNYFGLHEELEYLFSRKVDLITERSLSNPYFIEGVEKTKQLLYAA